MCHFLGLLLLSCVFISCIDTAGDYDGRFSGSIPDAVELHLDGWWEHSRTLDSEYDNVGAGLFTEYLTADVIVAGGGSAGVSAALSAARNGAKVIVVQSRKVLGGNASSESKLNMVGAAKSGGRGTKLKTEARESGIVEEYILDNCVSNPQRCGEMLDLSLYNLFKLEPNIQLILNTDVVSAIKNPETNTITSVTAICQSSQIKYIINGKIFIDSTGDGRLGAEAYVPFIIGREGKSEYNESLAINQTDNETEGSSFAFTSRDQGKVTTFTPPVWARKFNETDFKYRHIDEIDYGFWWIEISYPYNNVRDNNKIQDLLLANVLGIWDYIKNSGNFPQAATWSLSWFESWPCKREGRRFIGQYVQTQNDILPVVGKTDFAPLLYYDRVAYGGWNFDLHNPKGIYDTAHPPYSSTSIPYIYSTPLRSLIASNVSNLFLAGRLASFSQVVYGSQRVMKTCSTHGQAVGTAAAYCVQHGILPIDLPKNNDSVWSIQQQLIRDDAYVIGIYNQDKRDHALNASSITASSVYINESDPSINGNPWNVISGQTRAVDGPAGVAFGGYKPGINRWMSNATEWPAWIQLEWNYTLTNLSSIQLIFDTGLHRKLTLSQKENNQKGQYWGEAQPETVSDYSLELRVGTKYNKIINVQNNYQRRRIHNITEIAKGMNVNAIRMNVTAMNDNDQDSHVRLCEIRIYDKIHGDEPFPTK